MIKNISRVFSSYYLEAIIFTLRNGLGWVGFSGIKPNPQTGWVGPNWVGSRVGSYGSPNLPRFTNNRLLGLIRPNTNLLNLIRHNKTLNLNFY